MLLDKIQELLNEVSTLTAKSADDVEQLRLKYLSKKGEINALMGEFRNVAADQKKAVGMKINELKQLTQNKINDLKEQLETSEAQSDDIDLTRTAYPISLGTRHPLTLVKNEIIDIFARMGFTLYQGPEIDDDQHVFTMLNFAADHPARDMQDTFYITEEILLRTHTSPVQARTLDKHDFSKGPLKMISPGRVFRRDTDDATHSHQFHQIEGLVVGKNISMGDLKGTLEMIIQKMFGAERQIRLRPSYFPFTEPSVEVDVSCFKCGGAGCNVCKKTGWIEIMGAGMVHPRVLEMSGIDPTVYSGFAFGLGQERVAMLRYGINDIRGFYQGDVRFSEQFK